VEIGGHINIEKNYGVLCGYGGLIVIDCDTKELEEAITNTLPKTFKVRTGSGGLHIYYICKTIKKKIVLQNDDKHFGEVQSVGTQVVGPGSIHPNGNEYKVIDEGPIAEITQEQLTLAVKPFMKEIKEEEIRTIRSLANYGSSDINSISISNVISTAGFKRAANGEYYGTNPWHGSETGMNFWINDSKNLAHCFRCNCGLNVAQAIALENGIIKNCYDKLSKDDFKKVLDIAREKYGLKEKPRVEIRKIVQENKDKIAQEEEFLLDCFTQFTDYLTIAKEFVRKHPVYYDPGKNWWIWDFTKHCYILEDETSILNALDQKVKSPSVNSKIKNECLEALKRIGRTNKPKDIKKTWLQFDDTIVDVQDGKEIKASPEYFVCNPIPWKLNKDRLMETPMMDKIFTEWVGEENVKLLFEIIAYCLLPDYPIHRLFVLIGGGMNGKSRFLELIRKFLGINNVTSTELDTLLASRFEITRLHKKLLCIMGETNFNELKKTSIIKKLTGGDLIGFEYKNKTPFEDYCYAKIIIATNNLPTTDDKTIGFYRRWTIIDFPNMFSEQKDILADIPEEEYESLALKCTFILNDLLKDRKFTNEGEIEDRAKKFEEKSNPMQKFIKEFINQTDPNSWISSAEFNKRLKEWLHANKHREIDERTVGKFIKENGFELGKKYVDWLYDGKGGQIRVFFGMGWKDDYTQKDR
jgi:P4 family phage/plasmid primase-like protien